MELKSVNNNERNVQVVQQKSDIAVQQRQSDQQQNKVLEVSQQQNRRDSLEISDEGKKLLTIKSQFADGFYNQNDVIKATAENINSSFPKESMTN